VSGTATAARPVEFLPARVKWAPVVVLVAFGVVGLVSARPDPPIAFVAAAVVAGVSPLLVEPRRPLLLLYAAVATAGIAVIADGTSSTVAWFAVCLLAGWCALLGGRRDGLVFWSGAISLFAAEWLWVDSDPGWAAWMAGTTLTTLAGLLVRHELDLVAQLRAAQAGLTDRAKAEERNRIARELHDVIAHTLTVSLLHVTSARLAVEFDPADAARALAEAERLGRESLDEVRSAVGLLRQDGDITGTAPLPGAGEVPTLVERFRSAGVDVTLTVDGDTARLPATAGLAVYRIVQEAMTNAIKHAPGASIAVRLNVAAGSVGVAVDSSGPPGRGSGLGVISMRERAESLGGSCAAGPGGQGWLVQATLPLGPASQLHGAAT
jgi:signal transduction histidine kinase